MTRNETETGWERGWDGHNQSQLRRLAGLPLSEKLRWLEDAQQLVQRLSQQRDVRESAPTSRPSPGL